MKNIRIEIPDNVAAALAVYAADCELSERSAAVALIAAALGVEYTPPKHGGWRGNPASIEALMKRADELTDEGRNDPATPDK